MAQDNPSGHGSYMHGHPLASDWDPLYTATSVPEDWTFSGNALSHGMSDSLSSSELHFQSLGGPYSEVITSAGRAGRVVRPAQDERPAHPIVQRDQAYSPTLVPPVPFNTHLMDSINQKPFPSTLAAVFPTPIPEPKELETSGVTLHANGVPPELMQWTLPTTTQDMINGQVHWPGNGILMANTHRSYRSQEQRSHAHHFVDALSTTGSQRPFVLGSRDAYNPSFASGLGIAPSIISSSYSSCSEDLSYEAVNMDIASTKAYPTLSGFCGSLIHHSGDEPSVLFDQLSNHNADPWNPQRPFFQSQECESEFSPSWLRRKVPIPPSSTMPWKSHCNERDINQPDHSNCTPRPKRLRRLTKEGREHASKVRKVGACKSCRDAKVKCEHILLEDLGMPPDKKKRHNSPQGSSKTSVSPRKPASTPRSASDSSSVKPHPGGRHPVKPPHGMISLQNPATRGNVDHPGSSGEPCHFSTVSFSSQQTENSQEDSPDVVSHLYEIQDRDLLTRDFSA